MYIKNTAVPSFGGHLPWADIFPMYELLSNLIQPLMNGHLLNADRVFWFYWMFYDHFSARSLLAKLGRLTQTGTVYILIIYDWTIVSPVRTSYGGYNNIVSLLFIYFMNKQSDSSDLNYRFQNQARSININRSCKIWSGCV